MGGSGGGVGGKGVAQLRRGGRGRTRTWERVGGVWRRERYAVSLLCTICNPVAREQQRERDTKEQIERGGRFDGRFVYVPCAAPEKDEREAGEPAGEDEKPAALVVVAPPPHDKLHGKKRSSFSEIGFLDRRGEGGGRAPSTLHTVTDTVTVDEHGVRITLVFIAYAYV